MSIQEVLSSRDKSVQIGVFVQQSMDIYRHYESLNQRIDMDYIAINLSSIKTLKKGRIIGKLADEEQLNQMKDSAQQLLKARLGKQAAVQIAVALVIAFLWFLFFMQVLKTHVAIAIISSIIAFAIVIYFLMKTTSQRLVHTTQKVYKQKVDSKLQGYFDHYYG